MQNTRRTTRSAKNMKPGLLFFAALVSFSCLIGCEKKNGTTAADPSDPQAALAQKGRAVYQTQCIACHNSDPKKAGAVGPEIWGSSRELLEARVLRAEYPAGYKPKRNTSAMAPMPQLKNDLDALHAYLNQ